MGSPNDRIADLLQLATTEPAHRPEFCRALLDSEVFVIGRTDDGGTGTKVVPAGARLSIEQWNRVDGSAVIPFFTSREVLASSVDHEVSFVALSARALFEMTRGATLVLNPRSSYAKEFVPAEIASLLSVGIGTRGETRIVQKDTPVLLGQPRDYPDALVASLRTLFAKHRSVRAAYLALMHEEGATSPHLVIGVEADGESAAAIRDAGSIVVELARPGEPVDLMVVERGAAGLSRYFVDETTPFYVRAAPDDGNGGARPGWAAKLKGLFGRA